MSLFLALECSTAEGSLALLESDEKQLNCLCFKKWLSHFNGKFVENPHSDKLPQEIHLVLKAVNKKLSDLSFLAVGIGPGRWTGVRTAINVIRSLAFCFKIPVYPVNSLRVCAEAVLSSSSPVFVAMNGFKNTVYSAQFHPEDLEGKLSLLTLPDWLKKMKNHSRLFKEKKPICLSDLEDFYPIPQNIKTSFSFKKLCPDAFNLARIIFNQKEKRTHQSWSQLKAFYLRSPLE